MLCLVPGCEKLMTSCANLVSPRKSDQPRSWKIQLASLLSELSWQNLPGNTVAAEHQCNLTPWSAIAEDYASLMEVRNPFSGRKKVHSALSE